MSKKGQEIYSKQGTENENTFFSKTGYSNSRLNRHTNIANTFIAPNQSIPTLVSSKNEEKKDMGVQRLK